MNIPEEYLRRDVARARAWWGGLIDDAERRHGIPTRLLYAVYSRETNLGRHWRTPPPASWPPAPTADDFTYFIRNAGDGGHGRGIGQVDDRSHAIPGDWATDVEWQVERSAEILAAALRAEGGAVVRAANRYNSGQGETSRTTGKDYGPDVVERWRFLVGEPTSGEEKPMTDGPAADKALAFLREHLGLGEHPPGSNRNWISEWYGMIGAWCAMATSRALIAAGFGTPDRIDVPGLRTTSAKGWAYVPYLRSDFIAAGRYDRNPVVGDLVVFAWEPGSPVGDHVGMLEEIVGDGTFLVLEGNTDDGVLARKRRSMQFIDGFCHPPYSAGIVGQPQEEPVSIIVFDARPERGAGVWQSDGVIRKPVRTGDTWPALEAAGAKHIGVAPNGLFDDLIDIEAQLAALKPAPVVDVDVEGLDPQAVADLVVKRLGGGLAREVADLLAQRLAS